MDKSQSELLFEVLRRFDVDGVLSKLVVVGSWCLPFYRDHYFRDQALTVLRTRDLDFLVPREAVFEHKTDIPHLLEDLGFLLDHSYPEGHMRLSHPELIIEFLVPDRGRGTSKPYPLPELSMNAQALRFLDMLKEDPAEVTVNGLTITVPHPVHFGLHKLIISNRRNDTDKRERDRNAGLSVLNACLETGEQDRLVQLYLRLSAKEQNKILELLKDSNAENILSVLS